MITVFSLLYKGIAPWIYMIMRVSEVVVFVEDLLSFRTPAIKKVFVNSSTILAPVKSFIYDHFLEHTRKLCFRLTSYIY